MATVQPSPADRRNPWWVLGAAGAVVVAAPFAVWSWVGDLSSAGADLDYMSHPPVLSSTQESIVLVASTSALVVGVVVLFAARAKGATLSADPRPDGDLGGLVLLAALPTTAVTALAIVLILMAHRSPGRAQ